MPKISEEQLIGKLKVLFPNFSHDEILAAKATLDRYLLLAWDIFEDLQRQGALTDSPPSSSIQVKVDSPNTNPHQT
jgi:hypothetical protein